MSIGGACLNNCARCIIRYTQCLCQYFCDGECGACPTHLFDRPFGYPFENLRLTVRRGRVHYRKAKQSHDLEDSGARPAALDQSIYRYRWQSAPFSLIIHSYQDGIGRKESIAFFNSPPPTPLLWSWHMGDQTYPAGRQRRYSKLRPERRLADARYARPSPRGVCDSIVTHGSYDRN